MAVEMYTFNPVLVGSIMAFAPAALQRIQGEAATAPGAGEVVLVVISALIIAGGLKATVGVGEGCLLRMCAGLVIIGPGLAALHWWHDEELLLMALTGGEAAAGLVIFLFAGWICPEPAEP